MIFQRVLRRPVVHTFSCYSTSNLYLSIRKPLFFLAALLGDKMLFFGGTGIPFGETASNEVHVCDLNSFRWSLLLTTGEKPTPRYGAVSRPRYLVVLKSSALKLLCVCMFVAGDDVVRFEVVRVWWNNGLGV